MPTAVTSSPCDTPARAAGLMAAVVRHYDELITHVRNHIGRRGGNKADAHDVVHDVCVELIEAPPACEILVPLAFLREVASRRAIDRHRVEQGRRAWVDSVGELPDTADESLLGRDPAAQFAGRQQIQRLSDAIHALPPRCRDVFVMHKIHEMRQAEVAEHLGISIKTVEKHLRLGIAACRAALFESEPVTPTAQETR